MGCTPSKGKGGDLTTTERVMGGRVAIDKSERINSKSERARLAKERAKVLKAHNASSSSPPPLPPKLDAGGHLTAEEVARRVSGSVESQEALVGDLRSGSDADPDGVIRVRYAALTQRGYYPDNPHKENQDSYFMCPSKFASGDGDAFFAVFDGHGDDGHDCARFAKARLPAYLAGAIKKRRAAANAARLRAMAAAGQEKPANAFHPTNWPHLEEGEYEACCREAHLRCNAAMQAAKEIKDKVSGTTAVSVGFHAGRMTVSNVGDSRVVLGHRAGKTADSSATPAEEEKREIDDEFGDEEQAIPNPNEPDISKGGGGGGLIAVPLSEDQTPYRRDERDRLKAAGARVCSIDQMEGKEPMHENWGEVTLGVDIDEHGDPPRVWLQDHDYPGTAFSRSLGDSVGEDVGVVAEPELLTKEVTRGDEILVIASDGVFEFLTNQRVVDVCAECRDPMHACTRLLEESYKQWLHYERRTDDITCVVLFLECGREDDAAAMGELAGRGRRIERAPRTNRRAQDPKHSGSMVNAEKIDADLLDAEP